MPEARVAPPISTVDAERAAAELYGISGAARSLPGEYDDNYLLEAADGRRFVLKLMHPARDLAFVEMQCEALQHLARRAPQLELPRVQPAGDGSSYGAWRAPDGGQRVVWLLSWLPGTVLAEARPKSVDLPQSLGKFLGEMDTALADFAHPATLRELKWDITRSLWAREFLPHIGDERRRALATMVLDYFERNTVPLLATLRRSVIYGDANDHNTLVSPAWPQPRRVTGLIDFGDLHESITVAEPAIAAAYTILEEERPLGVAAEVLRGYHDAHPLTEDEIEVFFSLVAVRLAVSVVNSARRKTLVPDDPYVTVTEAAAWRTLEKLAGIDPQFARCVFRGACGLPAARTGARVAAWLEAHGPEAAAVIPQRLEKGRAIVLDLSVGSALIPSDPAQMSEPALTAKLKELLRANGAEVAIGRYDEPRSLYTSPLFGDPENPVAERRTIHLGIDLFADPGTTVAAPFDATVHAVAYNSAPLDYGPVVLLYHHPEPGVSFYTIYGHLSAASVAHLTPGEKLSRGQVFAALGEARENGGWTPHLHFQIALSLLDRGSDFPGVAPASERKVWTGLSPDPNAILRIPAEVFPEAPQDCEVTLAERRRLLGKNLSVSYQKPLKIVRGWREFLYDETGRTFLDVYNNVPLVGHSHPRVVEAITEQLRLLNTNTRYLHDNILRYAERLTARMPEPLRVCYFVNSGSEANELAIRLARTHTGREDLVVLEHGYHGNTTTLIDASPYKFDGPGGKGRKPWVHVAPLADDYRGKYRRGDGDLGAKYATDVEAILARLEAEGKGIAAYLAETLPSVGGQIVFPEGYLKRVYERVRTRGGVCIADEVQVGFGRLGTHFWGFETQGVVPDIVVLGKPIGNAFPLAAVVTTVEIAASFANGMEYFSTFGGNPVACAAGLAVLDVLRDEELQKNAREVGAHWMNMLRELQARFPLVGDVRGSGLFLGIDLVRDAETRAAATEQAAYVVNRLRDRGILAGTDGPLHNVIKLRPPLVFTRADAALFTRTLGEILREDAAQPGA